MRIGYSGLMAASRVRWPSLRFSFSQEQVQKSLKNKIINKHFNRNKEEADKLIAELSRKYKWSEDQSDKFFEKYPLAFKPGTPSNRFLSNRVAWLQEQAAQGNPMAQIFTNVLFDNDSLAFRMGQDKLQQIFTKVESLQMTDEQIQSLFTTCPNLINPKFASIVDQKCKILKDYLHCDVQECLEIFQRSPFLLPGSTNHLRQVIVELVETYKCSRDQVIALMKDNGETFLLAGRQVHDLYRIPRGWGLTRDEVRESYLNNPLLFFNYPYEVFPLKKKILRYMNFTMQMGADLFRKYPAILVWSVGSLEAKAVFLKTRLKVQITPDNYPLLCRKFNKTIRPYGQLLIRSKYSFNKDNILSLMAMSDSEFIEQLHIDSNKLEEQRNKFPVTEQLDYYKKKAFKMTDFKSKMVRMAQQYNN